MNIRIELSLESYKTALEEAEAKIYELAYQSAKYNQVKAARMLGVSRNTLRTKLDKYFPDKYINTAELIFNPPKEYYNE